MTEPEHHVPQNALSQNEALPIVEVQGLVAGYGGLAVVNEVSLSVRPGEVVALFGPNGAGKTTTLLNLVGEMRPLGGRVIWNGSGGWTPLHKSARRGVAFIPEDRSVFAQLTVDQNIRISWKNSASYRSEIVQMFPELEHLMSRRAGLLSGGEQRMLAVARALSGGCRLLLADELSLGLAPKTVATILTALRRAADDGVGVLIVEQHVHKVLDIADRVYVMQGGRVRFSGTSTEARDQLDTIRNEYLSTGSGVEELAG
jgi:ABC-type branched-subunit amino acid transport system ATPase component